MIYIKVDDICYNFTKSSGKHDGFRALPQRYCCKNCQAMLTTHFSWKERKYGKKRLEEQVEPNLNISE